MIQKRENMLQTMLYKKTNAVISLLQEYEAKKIDADTCLQQIKEQYLDTQFIDLLNQKNDDHKENKKNHKIY